MTTERGLRIGEAAFGMVIFGLGVFFAVGTARLGAGPEYAVVGPRFFPAVIAAGLLIIGALELRAAIWGHIRHEGEAFELDWQAVGLIAGALLAEALLLTLIGWIPSATLLFFAVGWAFGNRSIVKAVLIGVVLAGATALIFNYLLGLSLPWGKLIEPLLS